MKPDILLTDFSQALAQFADALKVPASHDVIRAGCIQYFEFSFELAWESIKLVAELEGLNPGGSPKACLRVAFMQKWIAEEVIWLEMLEVRNRISHTYNAQEALTIYERLPTFLKPLSDLSLSLGKRL